MTNGSSNFKQLRRVVGFSGNIQRPSRTRNLVSSTIERISNRYKIESKVYDLLDVLPELGLALRRNEASEKVSKILDAVECADILVVGTPVYKGSYTGLFKHFFDLVVPERLAGVPVVITATGGGDRHALMVEHQLRPLFGFFAAHTIATAVYASEKDFSDGQLSSESVISRIESAVRDLAPWLEENDGRKAATMVLL